jgi:apolipoprotein N-acyltransferase
VPVVRDETTLYTRWGDWFAYLSLCVAAAAVLAAAALRLLARKRN